MTTRETPNGKTISPTAAIQGNLCVKDAIKDITDDARGQLKRNQKGVFRGPEAAEGLPIITSPRWEEGMALAPPKDQVRGKNKRLCSVVRRDKRNVQKIEEPSRGSVRVFTSKEKDGTSQEKDKPGRKRSKGDESGEQKTKTYGTSFGKKS